MRRSRPGIGSELLPVALILIGLGGTLGLVVSMHRKVGAGRSSGPKVAATAPVPVPPAVPEPLQPPAEPEEPSAPPPPVVVQPPPPPPEDPTRKALQQLNGQAEEQLRAAREADSKAESLEIAIKAASADARRWRNRDALVRGQVSRLTDKATAMEMEADSLAMERDALAHELDASKAAVVKARARNGGYAVMPNKSANGTWQRPVMIECRDGQAILQPKGLRFSMLDLSGIMSTRSNPFVLAVGRELIHAHRTDSPDGAPVVPYFYFIIRPDGIRPYYEARGRLEPLGIAFGYELVEADWEIEFPDFDELDSWDGSPSTRPRDPNRAGGSSSPLAGNGGRGAGSGNGNAPGSDVGTGNGSGQVAGAYGFVWPNSRPGTGRGVNGSGTATGTGTGNSQAGGSRNPGRGSGNNGLDDVADAKGFVWPADRPGGVRGGGGIWPTQPLAEAGGGGPGQAGGGSGTAGTVPPLEMADGTEGGRGTGTGNGSNVSPFSGLNPGQGTGGTPGTPGGPPRFLPGSAGGQPPGGFGMMGQGAQRGTAGPAGLVRLGPDGLPRLENPETSTSGQAKGRETGGTSSTPQPGLAGAGTGIDPTRFAGTPGAPGGMAPNPGNLPPTGSGTAPAGNLALSGSGTLPPGNLPPSGSGTPPSGNLTPFSPGTPPPGNLALSGSGTLPPGNLPPSGSGTAPAGNVPVGAGLSPGGTEGSKPNLPNLPNVAPPPGWVHLDPTLLARAIQGDDDDPDRPPAQPSTLRPGSRGSGSGSSLSNSAQSSSNGTPSTSGGSSGTPSPPSAGPGIPSFGSGSSNQKGDYRPKPMTSRGWTPMMTRTINVPLNLVVACGPDGVVVHPGGYRLSRAALAKDGALKRDLQTIVRNHELIDGSVHPVPRVQFLVEPGGSETFTQARRQTVLSGLTWPVTIQVAGGQAQASNVFPKERF